MVTYIYIRIDVEIEAAQCAALKQFGLSFHQYEPPDPLTGLCAASNVTVPTRIFADEVFPARHIHIDSIESPSFEKRWPEGHASSNAHSIGGGGMLIRP